MAIICEGSTKVSLTTWSFSISLPSGSFQYYVPWTFASFFHLHVLTVAFGLFHAPVTKGFAWLLNNLLNLSCSASHSLIAWLIFFYPVLLFCFILGFFVVVVFKFPVVSSTTKKLCKKEKTWWGDSHFAVCYVVQWLHILYSYAVTWISDPLQFSSLSFFCSHS